MQYLVNLTNKLKQMNMNLSSKTRKRQSKIEVKYSHQRRLSMILINLFKF